MKLQKDRPKIVELAGVKDELWTAISDGGELQWIDDLDLLEHISHSYYFLRAIRLYERTYSDPLFNLTMYSDTVEAQATSAGKFAVEAVTTLRPLALEAIKKALEAIEKQMKILEETIS
ncbi:MAG: hypothetical protein HY259_08215 [Chloroflexi bacterium]|nr:hypothetical protein [Chloroflexota bacterium]MBI3733424.1 hypothetical protein [Chloroflexota bacterium]